MLMIRLQRVGRKHDPSFRVVLTDSKNGPQSGKFIEILGNYDARQGKPTLDAERIKHWVSKGAKTSDTVHNLLVRTGAVKAAKVHVGKKSKKPAEAAPAA